MTRTLFASLCLTAAIAFAEGEEGAPAAPTPSKELDAFLSRAVGTWTCTTRIPAGAMKPDSPETTQTSTLKIAKEKGMNGLWYRAESTCKATQEHPAIRGVWTTGWDGQQVVNTGYDSMGSAWMGTGALDGEVLTVESEGVMFGEKMKFRETLTRGAGGTLIQKHDADRGDGYRPMGEATCTPKKGKQPQS